MDKTMDKTAVLDLPEALNRVDGGQELFLTLAELFLQESPKEAAAIRATLQRQDCAGLVVAAHKLKGSVIQMCAPRLFECAKRLEELGRQGSLLRPRRSLWISMHVWPRCMPHFEG